MVSVNHMLTPVGEGEVNPLIFSPARVTWREEGANFLTKKEVITDTKCLLTVRGVLIFIRLRNYCYGAIIIFDVLLRSSTRYEKSAKPT